MGFHQAFPRALERLRALQRVLIAGRAIAVDVDMTTFTSAR